jgi:hypothetical protein
MMIDFLMQLAIAVCFVAFAICLWVLKREKQKQKGTKGRDSVPPKLPGA